MRNLCLILALALAAEAADQDFNGRWNIKALGEPRNRAWWLEVEGAGAPNLKGQFVGFPGGDLNAIENIKISNGELYFTFDRPDRNIHQEYRARLVKQELEGTFASGSEKLKWIGARAPVITEKDDGSWRERKPVALFNGKDLSGWSALVPGKELGWTVKDGSMTNVAGANNLMSDAKFWNFALHLEYRVGPKSNSGIGLRARYEVQILDDHGRPPDTHGNGAIYSRILPQRNASKPAGEWQTFDIRLVGRQVTVILNGQKIIEKTEIQGLTAMATDANEAEPGPLTLQGDHGPVEFRKIVLTPLVRQ